MTSNSAKPLIAFVIYPGVKLLDLSGPLQVFQDARAAEDERLYETVVVSLDGGAVETDTPVSVSSQPVSALKRRSIDTLIVVGGMGSRLACKNEALRETLRTLSGRARRVGSVCTGALILAACGLLEGRRAVTHWESCDLLGRVSPGIEVEPDPIFIRDGKIWTSAGVTAGIDMALAMVEEDHGRQTALRLARSLVAYLVRPGGQSQFSVALDQQCADDEGKFTRLHDWMRSNLDQDLRVEHLAERANMSPRNFARVYTSATGRTPAKAVEIMRVEAARNMLEETASPISTVARTCGFGDDERMRRSFLRQINVAPQDYRKRFRQTAA